MSGVIYMDDSQVAEAHIFKYFGLPERVEIEVSEISAGGLFAESST
jgi:Holliday junction resolvase RusA-like endonuclease